MKIKRIKLTKTGMLLLLSPLMLLSSSCEEEIDSGVNSDVRQPQTTVDFARGESGITIVPGAVSVVSEAGVTLSFGVTGGSAPYQWRVSNNGLGSVNNNGLYQVAPNTQGTNTVSVRDSAGRGVAATVTHVRPAATSTNPPVVVTNVPPVTQTLTIIPSTLGPVCVFVNGVEKSVNINLAAAGGVPPYNWSTTKNIGTFDGSTSGSTVVYIAGGGERGDQEIIVRDSAGAFDVVKVQQIKCD